MNSYERLVSNAEFMGLEVIEKHFKSSAKGLCKGNKIGISKNVESSIEKRCILAEEMAHSFFTIGNILDQSDIRNVKQEQFARRIAYEYLVSLPLLIEAYEQGLQTCYEIAEFLEVTEQFLLSALCEHRKKYGLCAYHENYIIYFSPLAVCENHHMKAI